MNNFFRILAGGLFAVFIGISLAWSAGTVWKYVRNPIIAEKAVATETAAATATTDGTVISGFKKIIRYSADQEEDIVNQAASSLPAGADNKITATAYVVKDLTSGADVAMYNQDKLVPIASLTKLITAVVARRLIPPDAKITITSDVMATYGNTASFRVGESFTASDLMYPMLMVSSNDAAEAYARSYGRAKFLKAMNDFVQSIGAYRTYFADPSGLSPLNESTADDMALIVDWIRHNDPEIIALTEVKTKTIRNHTWVNPTHFLSWSYYIGGKNGYTDEADRTAVSLFELGIHKDVYIVVVLGSENRDADVIKLLNKVK